MLNLQLSLQCMFYDDNVHATDSNLLQERMTSVIAANLTHQYCTHPAPYCFAHRGPHLLQKQGDASFL